MVNDAAERETVLQELESFDSLDEAFEELSISTVKTENLLTVVEGLIDHLDDCVDRAEKRQNGHGKLLTQPALALKQARG
jgi:hypothetical protein